MHKRTVLFTLNNCCVLFPLHDFAVLCCSQPEAPLEVQSPALQPAGSCHAEVLGWSVPSVEGGSTFLPQYPSAQGPACTAMLLRVPRIRGQKNHFSIFRGSVRYSCYWPNYKHLEKKHIIYCDQLGMMPENRNHSWQCALESVVFGTALKVI